MSRCRPGRACKCSVAKCQARPNAFPSPIASRCSKPNLPPLREPGNGVYILLCDTARSNVAVPAHSSPTSVSREGQTVERCAEVTMLQVGFCFRSEDCFRSGLMSCQPIYDCQNRNAIHRREQTKMKAVLHNV